MTDRRSNDLHYGHFGEAVYNGESKEWQFNRTISESGCLVAHLSS